MEGNDRDELDCGATKGCEGKKSPDGLDPEKVDWEKFVPGDVFDASIPLRVHLPGEDKNYLELSLRDGQRFAIIYFDTNKRQVIIRGHEGREVPILVEPFDKPFPIGRDSLKCYTWFFGEAEKSVSSEQCIVTVVEPCEGSDGRIYPVVEVANKGRNDTFCRVFQNPNPQRSSSEQEQT